MNTYQNISMDDIIFEGRNKSYGAYELRHLTNRHAVLGLFITLGFCMAFLFVSKLPFFQPHRISAPPIIDVWVNLSEIPPQEIDKPQPVAHTTPPPANTARNLEKNIVLDNVPEKPPVNPEDLNKYTPGTETKINPDITTPTVTALVETPVVTANITVKTESKNTDIIKVAEVMPSFIGGTEALIKYLHNNIRPFQSDIENGGAGKVIVRFYIDVDGTVRNPEVIRDNIGGRCAEAAISAINKMPKWNPGRQGDKPVRVYYVLPVSFDFSGYQ